MHRTVVGQFATAQAAAQALSLLRERGFEVEDVRSAEDLLVSVHVDKPRLDEARAALLDAGAASVSVARDIS